MLCTQVRLALLLPPPLLPLPCPLLPALPPLGLLLSIVAAAVVLLRATHPSLDALTGGALMPPAVRLLKIHSVHFLSLPLSFLAAPEQLMGQRCSLAADLYSFGILLIELITQEQSGGRGEWRLPRAPEECPQVRKRVGEWVGGVAVWRCGLHKRERHAWAPG